MKTHTKKKGQRRPTNKLPLKKTTTTRTTTVSPRIRGKGSYFEDIARNVANIAPLAGGGIGAVLGGPAGAAVGGSVGSIIKRIFGSGAYTVSQNTIVDAVRMGNNVPTFGVMTEGTIVRHREYLGDVQEPANNAGAFLNRSYFINPGLTLTFPWLSALAANYQQYRLRGAVFEFCSTSATVNNASTAGLGMGTIVLASNYDVLAAAYPSKLVADNAQYTVSAVPYVNQQHPIECAPNQTSVPIMYVRTTGLTAGQDQRLYDLARFQLITYGIPNSTSVQTLGELWISYDVQLLKPVVFGGSFGGTTPTWRFIVNSSNGAWAGAGSASADIVPCTGNSPQPPTFAYNSGADNNINLPVGFSGTYQLNVLYEAKTAFTITSGFAITANTPGVSFWRSSVVGDFSSGGSIAGDVTHYVGFYVNFALTQPSVVGDGIAINLGVPTSVPGIIMISGVNPQIVA